MNELATTSFLLGLGSNLGDFARQFDAAIESLQRVRALVVTACSAVVESQAVGGPAQPPYANAVLRGATTLSSEELLQIAMDVERRLGRKRGERWGPRSIDLDLLLHGEAVLSTAELIVPHPRMLVRPFVLGPAAEVAPEMSHPVAGGRLDQLWEIWSDWDLPVAISRGTSAESSVGGIDEPDSDGANSGDANSGVANFDGANSEVANSDGANSDGTAARIASDAAEGRERRHESLVLAELIGEARAAGLRLDVVKTAPPRARCWIRLERHPAEAPTERPEIPVLYVGGAASTAARETCAETFAETFAETCAETCAEIRAAFQALTTRVRPHVG